MVDEQEGPFQGSLGLGKAAFTSAIAQLADRSASFVLTFVHLPIAFRLVSQFKQAIAGIMTLAASGTSQITA